MQPVIHCVVHKAVDVSRAIVAAHWSEYTTEPGRIWRCIIGSSVSESRRSTICMNPKAGLLVQSAMPNNHISFCGALPLWYLGLCAKRDSSIWTIRPGPSSFTGFRINAALQTSRKKL